MRPYYSSKIQSRLELHSNPQNAINRDTYMVHAISLHLVLRYTFTILHHTSTEIWNWELGSLGFVALRADSSYQTRGIVLRRYALPWHGALSSPGAWFPASRDRATKPRSSALARLHLGTSMGIPVGCLPSSSMIFALDSNWISRKFSINLVSNHQGCMKIRSPSWIAPKWNPTFWYWICYFGCLGDGFASNRPNTMKTWRVTGYRVKMGVDPFPKIWVGTNRNTIFSDHGMQ